MPDNPELTLSIFAGLISRPLTPTSQRFSVQSWIESGTASS